MDPEAVGVLVRWSEQAVAEQGILVRWIWRWLGPIWAACVEHGKYRKTAANNRRIADKFLFIWNYLQSEKVALVGIRSRFSIHVISFTSK